MAMVTAMKQQQFSTLIESMVADGITTYLEAISEYMENTDVEPNQVKKLISPLLQEKLLIECSANNLIVKDDFAALPL